MNNLIFGSVADSVSPYVQELNPLRCRFALLNAGIVPPTIRTACELNFGVGLSLNFHAAASDIVWWGNAENAAQASYANNQAAYHKGSCHLHNQSIVDFCSRDDLPVFDFIGLNDAWSWLSNAERMAVVAFVSRKLRAGGVFYVSYDTQPGCAAAMPLQHLLERYADRFVPRAAGALERRAAVVDFAKRLWAVQPGFSFAHPDPFNLLPSIETFSVGGKHPHGGGDRGQWRPMMFSDVAYCLRDAKLDFACSAHYPDWVAPVILKDEQRKLLGGIENPVFTETVSDFLMNRCHRQDYWIKGVRRVSGREQDDAVRRQRVVLQMSRQEVPLKISHDEGEVILDSLIFNPLLEKMSDHRPRSIAEIERALAGFGVGFHQLREAIMVLMAGNAMAPAQAEPGLVLRTSANAMNGAVLAHAKFSGDIHHLVSPHTAGGVSVSRNSQLFLLAAYAGHDSPESMANFALQILAETSGSREESPSGDACPDEPDREELTLQAKEFSRHQRLLEKILGAELGTGSARPKGQGYSYSLDLDHWPHPRRYRV